MVIGGHDSKLASKCSAHVAEEPRSISSEDSW